MEVKKNEIIPYSQNEIIPESLHQAITLYTSHLDKLFYGYRYWCFKNRENIKIHIGDSFGDSVIRIEMEKAFDGINSIQSKGLINYLEKFILEATETLHLQKNYNVIDQKINEELDKLDTQNSRQDVNPIVDKLIFFRAPPEKWRLWNFIINTGNKRNEKGNIEDYNKMLHADDLYNSIVDDIRITKQKIDNLFSIKKLNEIAQKENQPHTIPPPKTSIHSFTLINNNNNNKQALESVLNTLKSNNFISDNNTLPQFKKVFSGEAVTKKVNWIGNVNELHWFVKWLVYGIDEIKPKIKTMPKQIWQVSFLCFEVKNKKGEIVTSKKMSSNNSDVSLEKRVLLIKAINHLQ